MFLNKQDDEEKKALSKTTALEALGFLTALLMAPLRFMERRALFFCDNWGSVIAFKKGYSGDPWATTIVRATRVVAAGPGCTLDTKWEKRCSSRPARIADNLTHNILEELTLVEVEAYLRRNTSVFPYPIRSWMADPGRNLSWGRFCLDWLKRKFPELRFLS